MRQRDGDGARPAWQNPGIAAAVKIRGQGRVYFCSLTRPTPDA